MNTSLAIQMFFSIIGGLGIFLLGMKNMSEGMQAVAGERMRKIINAVTNNRLIACGAGIAITSLIQSSSVTSVMVVGMVNAGLMNLTQAIGVILGAGIGTTITAWILVLEIAKYGLPIAGVSAFFFLFSKNERTRYTAMMALGLGLVFFGLAQMKAGFSPLREMPEFIAWFSKFSPNSYFGIIRCCLVGAVVTAIIQSSSATVGITMGLAGAGVIDFETAAALVLGENIGTTITACLASIGASTNAKRASVANVVIKIIGAVWIIAIFPFYIGIIKSLIVDDPATMVMVNGVPTFTHAMRGIALSHTCFNVANVIILMPFTTLLAKALCHFMPDKKREEVPHLKYLDVRMLDTPAMSIEQSNKEILKMGEDVTKMLAQLESVLTSKERNKTIEEKIFSLEELLDVAQKEIVEFLSNLLSGNVPHTVMNKGRIQLRMADEYESISDYITNILKLNLKMRKSGMQMSDETHRNIIDLHNQIKDYLHFVNDSVKDGETEILSKALKWGDKITHRMKKFRSSHLERVEGGLTSPLQSLIVTDMLNSYRRVKDHALNIAEVLAGEK